MRVSTTRAPAEAQNRLDRARLALRLAEDLTAFVTYDRQLGRAALDAGLPVVSPGCEL